MALPAIAALGPLVRRFLPHILAVLAVGGAIWIVSDRISDADERATAATQRAAKAEASAAQWQSASQLQSESILKLADSYKLLSEGMDARDAKFQLVWRDTLAATGKLEDRARQLLSTPAVPAAQACDAAARSLRDTEGYGYAVTVQLPPLKEQTDAR